MKLVSDILFSIFYTALAGGTLIMFLDGANLAQNASMLSLNLIFGALFLGFFFARLRKPWSWVALPIAVVAVVTLLWVFHLSVGSM